MICAGNCTNHRRGHDALDAFAVFRQCSELCPGIQNIVQQKASKLVAGKTAKCYRSISRLDRHRDRHAVGIRIRCKDQIVIGRAGRSGNLDRLIKSRLRLRVRIGAGGEIAVRSCLGIHQVVVDAKLFKQRGYRAQACAVERCIQNFQTGAGNLIRRKGFVQDRGVVAVIHFLSDQFDFSLRHQRIVAECRFRDHRKLLHPGKDLCRRLIRLLASVVPIAFHSVVSRRIMTGGHYNTASGFQMPNSKGKHRRRSRSGIQINMDSLFGQCSCTDFREQAGIVPRVVRNGAGIRKRSLLDVLTVGQCGASYCIYVHAIRSGAHDAAESGSSEGQIVAETRFNFCAVPGNSL